MEVVAEDDEKTLTLREVRPCGRDGVMGAAFFLLPKIVDGAAVDLWTEFFFELLTEVVDDDVEFVNFFRESRKRVCKKRDAVNGKKRFGAGQGKRSHACSLACGKHNAF